MSDFIIAGGTMRYVKLLPYTRSVKIPIMPHPVFMGDADSIPDLAAALEVRYREVALVQRESVSGQEYWAAYDRETDTFFFNGEPDWLPVP